MLNLNANKSSSNVLWQVKIDVGLKYMTTEKVLSKKW